MAVHRYWRLYVTAAASPSSLESDITELYLRTVAGGASVATGGTAYADDYYNSSYVPANAFDGVDGTSWASNVTNWPHWIAYDLGAGNAKDIVEYGMKAIFTPGWSTLSPKDFKLQYSDDGTTWITADTRTGETWSGAGQVKSYSVTPGATGGASRVASQVFVCT